MAKTSITEVSANNTFQVWLDKTNELVDLFKTDAVTASLTTDAGDTTVGNITLEGIITANTVIAYDLLRVDQVSPKTGSTSIQVNSPVTIVTNQTVLERLSSNLGPRLSLFNTTDTDWQIGFENNTTKNFVISNGSNVFRLNSAGDLELTGILSGTAQTANTVGLVATNTTDSTHYPLFASSATGNVQVRSDTGFTYNPSTGTITATTFSGNLNGTATSASNAATATFATNAGNAATVTNGVYTTGAQTVAGAKTFTSNVIVSNSSPAIQFIDTDGSDYTVGAQSNQLRFYDGAGNVIVYFDSTGNIVADGDVTAFSDERLKTNIKTIENSLDKVLSLRGVSYEKDGKSSIGVIAQEVEKILPEVVYDGEFKSVAYGNIVGLLIEAIKELKTELDEVKRR